MENQTHQDISSLNLQVDSSVSCCINPTDVKEIQQFARECGSTECDVRIAAAAVGTEKSKIRKYLFDHHLCNQGLPHDILGSEGIFKNRDSDHLFYLFK